MMINNDSSYCSVAGILKCGFAGLFASRSEIAIHLLLPHLKLK